MQRAEAERLFERSAPAIYRRALGLVHDDARAMEITRKAFVEVFDAANADWSGPPSFQKLYVRVTAAALDHLRPTARWHARLHLPEPRISIDGDAEFPEPSTAPRGAELLEAAQEVALLTQDAEAEISTCLVLYFLEGCSVDTIAQILDCTAATIHTNLTEFARKARARMPALAGGQP
jgi:DNA-directed RNA polymerase specialized sigma24 family protein